MSILKEAMNKSRTNTHGMLGILNSFENRLQKLESTIEPVYNETEMLRRRQESILLIIKIMKMYSILLCYLNFMVLWSCFSLSSDVRSMSRILQYRTKIQSMYIIFSWFNKLSKIQIRRVVLSMYICLHNRSSPVSSDARFINNTIIFVPFGTNIL